MIQRTHLPNLAVSKYQKKQGSLSLSTHHNKKYQTLASSNIQAKAKQLIRRQNQFQHYFSTLSDVIARKKIDNLKTQQNRESQLNSLESKMMSNPEVFHTKVQKYKAAQNEKNKIAPYFFKIHSSLKILQNQDQLKRKMLIAQSFQAQRLKTNSIQNSKKRLQKKISNDPLKKSQEFSDFNKHATLQSSKSHIKSTIDRPKCSTQPSEHQRTEQVIKDRKSELTQKAREAKYSFEHFNSGEIFQQIAQINEKKILSSSKQNQYRITAYGTYVNNISGPKFSDKQKAKRRIQEEFKEEYNNFLKSKLPPSFGENGKTSCIYQEYVQKRRQQQLAQVKSKLAEGNFLRSEPHEVQKPTFIFSNEVQVISSKRMQIQRLHQYKQIQKDEELLAKKSIPLIKNTSAQTSKMVTQLNTKMNTLRIGQSLNEKIKLKKLAKLQMREKAKFTQKQNQLKKTKQPNKNSSLSTYSNMISEAQMDKFLQKSQIILGRQIQLMNPEVQQDFSNSQYKNKGTQNPLEINKHEAKYLQSVDKLLKKQISLLKREKQDLDSYPWKISIKVEKKRNIQ